jgi:hypothetical protein
MIHCQGGETAGMRGSLSKRDKELYQIKGNALGVGPMVAAILNMSLRGGFATKQPPDMARDCFAALAMTLKMRIAAMVGMAFLSRELAPFDYTAGAS